MTCDQCGSNRRQSWCHACKTWQCSKQCQADHDRREHPHEDLRDSDREELT